MMILVEHIEEILVHSIDEEIILIRLADKKGWEHKKPAFSEADYWDDQFIEAII